MSNSESRLRCCDSAGAPGSGAVRVGAAGSRLEKTSRQIGVVLMAGALIALVVAPIAGAQEKKPYPIYTLDQFVAAMKTIGQALAAVNASLGKNDYDDAKAYLAISRDRLASTITFWRDRQRDDAIKMLREVLANMDALDDAMSVDRVDSAAVGQIARQVGTGCQTCHQIYREQDPNTKAYKVKLGSTD